MEKRYPPPPFLPVPANADAHVQPDDIIISKDDQDSASQMPTVKSKKNSKKAKVRLFESVDHQH